MTIHKYVYIKKSLPSKKLSRYQALVIIKNSCCPFPNTPIWAPTTKLVQTRSRSFYNEKSIKKKPLAIVEPLTERDASSWNQY